MTDPQIIIRSWIRGVFWLGPLAPGAEGAGILYAQDTCPIMNQPLVHDRALILGVWMAKHMSTREFAPL